MLFIMIKIREEPDLVVTDELRGGEVGIEMEQSKDLISFLTGKLGIFFR